jgi:hypothetical protein
MVLDHLECPCKVEGFVNLAQPTMNALLLFSKIHGWQAAAQAAGSIYMVFTPGRELPLPV